MFPQPEKVERNSLPDGKAELVAEEAIKLISIENDLRSAAGSIYQFSDLARVRNKKIEACLLTTLWLELSGLAEKVNMISTALVAYMGNPDQSDEILVHYDCRIKELAEEII